MFSRVARLLTRIASLLDPSTLAVTEVRSRSEHTVTVRHNRERFVLHFSDFDDQHPDREDC